MRNLEVRRALARFLRQRRTALRRGELDLPERPAEPPSAQEIARFAGIESRVYLRLETARSVGLLRSKVDRLAEALHLNATDRNTLLSLTNLTEQPLRTASSPSTQLLDHLQDCPAFVCNGQLDVIAYNQIAQRLFDFRSTGTERCNNPLWRIYLDPLHRRLFTNVKLEQRFWIQRIRTRLHSNPAISNLIQELSAASPAFAMEWDTPPSGRG